MNNIVYILIVLFGISSIMSCSSDNKTKKIIFIKESNILKKDIIVNGMTCIGCEVTLEENVSKIEGVVSIKATHKENKVSIEFDSTKTDIKTIKQTIKKAGYKTY